MEREVFVLPTGPSFAAWEVRLGKRRQHVESAPCNYEEAEGSFRKGTIHITVESASVSFCAYPDPAFHVGQKGQLSTPGDQFFDVTVESVEPAGDHLLVSGKALRKVKFESDR